MMQVPIVPQRIVVAAPRALIFEIISTVDYGTRPDSGHLVSLLSREAPRLIVAFASGNDKVHGPIVKEMVAHPPDRIYFRHLSGQLSGAEEELRLTPASGGTEVLLSATFPSRGITAYRLHKLAFEHDAQEFLQEIKSAAESRTRPVAAGPTTPSMLVPVPVLTSESDLMEAVEAQEEAEWGHVGHGRGVARVATSLAEAVVLPARQVEQITRAAMLHDAGKIALDSSLWGTRGTLTPEQRTLMESHPRFGYDLAARVGLPEQVLTCILHHHERWDGQGYPAGLAGEVIPLKARMLFLAEVIDSMLRATYRRQAMHPDMVADALEAGAGRQWDPMLARKAARIMRGRLHNASN